MWFSVYGTRPAGKIFKLSAFLMETNASSLSRRKLTIMCLPSIALKTEQVRLLDGIDEDLIWKASFRIVSFDILRQ